ncbi:MAG: 6-phosphofructokinase [Clostridia bacterium]|nr:6-phosphofructokinase [Clostridia bacterium]
MKNILVGQSGGPTAVINASLAGVISEAKKHSEIGEIYGMVNGIEGFLKDKFVNLRDLSDEDLELLKTTPAAYLGSCRFKLPKDFNDDTYKVLFEKFEKLNIGYVLYNGGNDSMDTADKLSKYAKMIDSDIKFIGIPKTIDNDLMGTDHTPGFPSAAKFVANTVRDITLDAEVYDKQSVTIVEIMGRHAGWLTAASVMARRFHGDNPVLIYLPESDFSMDKFFSDVKNALEKHKNLVVCVSEGIKDSTGKFICEYESEAGVDTFGHKNLTGCGKFLENEVKEKLGVKVRSVELNVVQRCASSLLSKTDVEEAFFVGVEGVKAVLNGETDKMICIIRDSEYSVSYKAVDVSEISNKEKNFPKEWIIDDNDIGDEFRKYILPLISGEVKIEYENGMAKYLTRK